MDILILGGGYGTRLFGEYDPQTYIPKGLMVINGKPCVEHLLEIFSNKLIGRIILETNNEGKEFYETWLNNSKFKDNVEIYVEKYSTPEKCLGVLDTIENVQEKYLFDKPVLILSPDNLFNFKQDNLIEDYSSGVRIAVYEVDSLNAAKKYGVVNLVSDKIVVCKEKPEKPSSKKIRTSCEIWDKKTFDFLKEWNSKFDSDKVGDFINYLICKNVKVESYKLKGQWIDIGNKKDLKKARGFF